MQYDPRFQMWRFWWCREVCGLCTEPRHTLAPQHSCLTVTVIPPWSRLPGLLHSEWHTRWTVACFSLTTTVVWHHHWACCFLPRSHFQVRKSSLVLIIVCFADISVWIWAAGLPPAVPFPLSAWWRRVCAQLARWAGRPPSQDLHAVTPLIHLCSLVVSVGHHATLLGGNAWHISTNIRAIQSICAETL